MTRIVALAFALIVASPLVAPAPARADVISDYRAELDKLALEMRALWGEIERFKIQQHYCLPPYGPVKQPDTMLMQAYSARADALNDRYKALKQSMQDFLARNTWALGRLMNAGKDPRDPSWWTRWEASRDKMIAERNAKRDALARAPERDCTPQAKPAIAVQPPPPLVLPQRPQIPPFNWPALPPHFCSELEKLNWKIANINPAYLREAEVAHAIARYRSQVEGLVNDHVQANKPIPPALAEARRQAIADSREMERIEKANAAFYRRFAAVPVIDCAPPRKEPVQTGMALPSDPRMRIILDEHNKARDAVGVPRLQWDSALAAAAQDYAGTLARTGQRIHSTREGRGTVRENLNQGMLGWSAGQMMDNWLKEKRDFTPGTYPDVTTTGRWQDVSHYTQMIWPTTTRVGCGLSSGSGYQWLVCRYDPGGNKDGQPVGQPVIAQDVAPTGSATPIPRIDPRDLPKVGGGMTQIDPPAPPPPTARDEAPDGIESNHPVAVLSIAAFDRHAAAVKKCDPTAARLALDELRYAVGELEKRLKDARRAGPYSRVNADAVEQTLQEARHLLRKAEDLSRRTSCPPLPPPPPLPPIERG